MTTRIELTYNGADLIVTGEYWNDATASEFWIASIEQDGEIVTAGFSDKQMEEIEARALEIVEDS